MELLSSNETGGFISLFIVNLLGVFLGANYLKKVHLDSFQKGLIVALVLALLNVTLGAVLNFMTTPLRWITLGVFSLFVDAVVILICDRLVKGFRVEGFSAAFVLAIIIAIVNVLFDWVF
ncbi:MAG: phage holin family protein [Bacteroidota bacterium]